MAASQLCYALPGFRATHPQLASEPSASAEDLSLMSGARSGQASPKASRLWAGRYRFVCFGSARGPSEYSRLPVFAFHTRAVASRLVVMIREPSALYFTSRT